MKKAGGYKRTNPVPLHILIMGKCASKSNSRRIVFRGAPGKRRPLSIKSKAAFEFSDAFAAQCPKFDTPILGDIKLRCNVYYPDYRSDLDESLVMDLLQKHGVIKNDRQIKRKDVRHGIDKHNPRVEITIEMMGLTDYPDTGCFTSLYIAQEKARKKAEESNREEPPSA